MQHLVKSWITEGVLMRQSIEQWANFVSKQDSQSISHLYHQKARLFPTFGSLKKGRAAISSYFQESQITAVTVHYGTLNYNPDDRLTEGEYTFKLSSGDLVSASFAFKFTKTGLILEHASAPKNLNNWRVRNEVSVCTLLTASTVKSVLKRHKEIEELVA